MNGREQDFSHAHVNNGNKSLSSMNVMSERGTSNSFTKLLHPINEGERIKYLDFEWQLRKS